MYWPDQIGSGDLRTFAWIDDNADHSKTFRQLRESINVNIKELGTNRNHPSVIKLCYKHQDFHLKNYKQDDTQVKLTDFTDMHSTEDAIMACFFIAHMASNPTYYGGAANNAEFHPQLRVEVTYSGHWRDPVVRGHWCDNQSA